MIVHLIIAFVLLATPAYAWGPATHVDLALSVLSSAPLLAAAIRKLLTTHQDSFIYGCASPDVILGKKYMDYMHNGHNWNVAWRILEHATTSKQKAAAFGFITHLAADTVAHNYYIPFKIIRSFDKRLPSHAYWEMRFDLGASESAWNRLGKGKTSKEFDELLEKELRRFAFSFKTNKAIFSTIMAVQRARALRKRLSHHAENSDLKFEIENRDHYFQIAFDASMDVLNKMKNSYVVKADPMGLDRISEAKKLRNQLRKRKRQGRLSEEELEIFLDHIKGILALGIYRPKLQLPYFE